MYVRFRDIIGIAPLRPDVQAIIDNSNLRAARVGTVVVMISQILSFYLSFFFQVQEESVLFMSRIEYHRVAYVVMFLAAFQFFLYSILHKPMNGGYSRLGLGLSMTIFHVSLSVLGMYFSISDYANDDQIFVFVCFELFVVGLFVLKPYIAFILITFSFTCFYLFMKKVAGITIAVALGFPVLYFCFLMINGIQYWRFLRIARYTVQNHIMAEQMKIMSLYDPLTKLKNRLALKNDFEKCLELPLIIMICDVDDFKIHNDTYGHEHGDDVLESFSHHLIRSFGSESCYRYGGDEFLVVCREDSLESFMMNLEKCRHAIGDAFHFSGGYITGIPHAFEDFKNMIIHADENLYKAKQNGKNQVIGC